MKDTLSDPVTDPTLVTRSSELIHNPADARHWMRARPVARRVTLKIGEVLIARTTDAIRLVELGRDAYEPSLYLPMADVLATLRPSTRPETFCPLKGTACYFDLDLPDGTIEGAAWQYRDLFEFSSVLEHRVAFYLDRITVEEAPIPA